MKRLATALVAVLALSAVFTLSACAVTGQPAHPGTAATYEGATITTAQVAAWGTAQNDMGYPYDPGAVLTLLLMRPALEAAAASEGIAFSDEQLSSDIQMWMAASGVSGEAEPTPGMIDVVRVVHTFHALAGTEPGAAAIIEDLKSIAANAQVNPLYGDFRYERFMDSANALDQSQQDMRTKLGPASYLVFRDVSGFDANAQRNWMVGEGAATAVPSPIPSPAP